MYVRKVLVILMLLSIFYLAYEYLTLPDVTYLKYENPKVTALMRIREEEHRRAGRKPRRYQVWVPFSRISRHLKSAVLVAEDTAFYEHEGIDFAELKKALKEDWEKKAFVRGASTITQQLAKNLYLSPARNPLRKLKELIIAKRLEDALSKDRIFELYLNVVEWGDCIYGAEAAARTYFNKTAAELQPHEAALLAAMLVNPRRLNPYTPSRRLERRRDLILLRMAKFGYISQEEYERAQNAELDMVRR